MTPVDSNTRSDSVGRDREVLIADILAMDKAITDFLNDLRERASWDKANIDSDGTVALPCGNGVLYRLGLARERLGKHLIPTPPALEERRG